MGSHGSRFAILALAAFCALSASAGRASAAEPTPAEVLAQHGLNRLGATNIWIVRLERDLRAHLDALPEHRLAVVALEQALAERIEQNAKQFIAGQQTEASLTTTLRTAQLDDAARRQMQARLAELNARMIPPSQLGDQEDVRKQLAALIARRQAIWLSIVAIRRDAPILADSYAPLTKQASVSAALKQLGPTQRLGPARNYVDELPKLVEYESVALTDWIPVYQQAGKPRVAAILNETTPVTFSWSSSPEATLLTSSAAEAAGIEVPADAPKMTVTLAKGRTLIARRATIPYLRLGKYLVRNVEAFVLPAEGEDFGSRMGIGAIADLQMEEQWERLRLVLSPKK